MNITLRAIRGGVSVPENDRGSIQRATLSLIDAVITENHIDKSDMECLWFTVTSDLTADIPPLALREEGGIDVPALCAAEADWEGCAPRTIRVLALVRLAENTVVQHVYLEGASRDRPSLEDGGEAHVGDEGGKTLG
ncbi:MULTISPECIES: chorismate mutase [Micrococcaceae]|uniref:chorismate mutase n=1 Tax=Micrococcaceae TaxID=1268 RepID=UPI00345FCC8B